MPLQVSRRGFVKTVSSALALGAGTLVQAEEAARSFEPKRQPVRRTSGCR
jgi:hypothetical protein